MAASRNPTFPFLGSFLSQARQFWSEPRADRLTWGPCAEVDPEGREFHFTVSAVSLPIAGSCVRTRSPRRADARAAPEGTRAALARERTGKTGLDDTQETDPIGNP